MDRRISESILAAVLFLALVSPWNAASPAICNTPMYDGICCDGTASPTLWPSGTGCCMGGQPYPGPTCPLLFEITPTPSPTPTPTVTPEPNACTTQAGECRLQDACPPQWRVADPDGVAKTACGQGRLEQWTCCLVGAPTPSPSTTPTPNPSATVSPSTPPAPSVNPSYPPNIRPDAAIRLSCPSNIMITRNVTLATLTLAYGQAACEPSVQIDVTSPKKKKSEVTHLGCVNGRSAFNVSTEGDGAYTVVANYSGSVDTCLFAVAGTPPQATPEIHPAVLLLGLLVAATAAYGRKTP